MNKKLIVLALVVLAVISLVIGIIYLARVSGSLPHFFPGYIKGGLHKRSKHGIVVIVLAVVLFIGAWMASGPSNKSLKPSEP